MTTMREIKMDVFCFTMNLYTKVARFLHIDNSCRCKNVYIDFEPWKKMIDDAETSAFQQETRRENVKKLQPVGRF